MTDEGGAGSVGAALDRHKLAAARLAASARLPYLATALFAPAILPAPDSGTIAVDRRWQVHADPACVERLDVEELARLLIHLAGHLLRDHAARAGQAGVEAHAPAGQRPAGPGTGADLTRAWEATDPTGVAGSGSPARWNRCADAEINDDLIFDGLVPASAPDTPDLLGCAEGELVEAMYATANDGPRHWDCGSGCDGVDRPWDGAGGIDPGALELLRLGVAADIQRQAGRAPGTVAGGWLRWAEAVLPSRTDWRRALAAEVRLGAASAAGNVDYTYRRPSRRAGAAPGVILPSLHRPLPEVAIVCDTSGSMHDALLARALAEVDGILRRVGVRQGRVPVLAVDATVQAVRRVASAAQVRLAGGGGTDMGRGVAAAAALRPRPSVIVVLTDGFTPWPATAPKGIRVVVGLLLDGFGSVAPPTPEWTRTIHITPDPLPSAR